MKNKEVKKLIERVLGDAIGRKHISTIITCNREMDQLERERNRWESTKHQAEAELITKFELTPQQDMMMTIAIGIEGIEKCMADLAKKKVKK